MGKLVEKLHQISAIQWIGRNNVLKIIQFIRIVFTQDLHGKANISRPVYFPCFRYCIF